MDTPWNVALGEGQGPTLTFKDETSPMWTVVSDDRTDDDV